MQCIGRLWLQRGWINACTERYKRAASLVKDSHAGFVYVKDRFELDTNYDLLHETFSILSKNELSTSSKIQKVIASYKSGAITNLLVEAITFENEHTALDAEASRAFRKARMVAVELWQLLELDAVRGAKPVAV